MQSPVEHVWQRLLDKRLDLTRMVARAEMAGDHQLVLESVLAIDPIIKVHVPMLVNLLLAVLPERRT